MKLTSYSKEHQLSSNASKTEFKVFSKISRKNQKKLLKIDCAFVGEKQEIKYLGVYIDNRLTFQSEVKVLIKKGPWNKNHIQNLQLLKKSSFKLILNALVLSHLHFSAVVFQSIGVKKFFSVNRKTNQLGLESFFLLVEF